MYFELELKVVFIFQSKNMENNHIFHFGVQGGGGLRSPWLYKENNKPWD
jgi:hypothetical protein